MPMRIFLAQYAIRHEGRSTIGVYSTEELAKEARKIETEQVEAPR